MGGGVGAGDGDAGPWIVSGCQGRRPGIVLRMDSSRGEVRDVNPIDPTGALGELSVALTSRSDMPGILDDVVHLVRKYLPGAEESSITLIRGRKASTVASTGALPLAL